MILNYLKFIINIRHNPCEYVIRSTQSHEYYGKKQSGKIRQKKTDAKYKSDQIRKCSCR
jgi:hypothetical protein